MVATSHDPKGNIYVTTDDVERAKMQLPSTWLGRTLVLSCVFRPLFSSNLPFLYWACLPAEHLIVRARELRTSWRSVSQWLSVLRENSDSVLCSYSIPCLFHPRPRHTVQNARSREVARVASSLDEHIRFPCSGLLEPVPGPSGANDNWFKPEPSVISAPVAHACEELYSSKQLRRRVASFQL